MGLLNRIKSISFELTLFAICAVALNFLYIDPDKTDQIQALMMPPPFVEQLNFGYRYVIADSLYMRALQDVRYCEKKVAGNRCKAEGWLFQMFDLTGRLSPDFLSLFRIGGTLLSVIVNDIEGASKFFDRAVELYPNDWRIQFQAGFHAWIEEKNKAKAAPRFAAAAKNGGHSWYYDVSATLFNDTGQRDAAIMIYRDFKAQKVRPDLLEAMKVRLKIPKDAE